MLVQFRLRKRPDGRHHALIVHAAGVSEHVLDKESLDQESTKVIKHMISLFRSVRHFDFPLQLMDGCRSRMRKYMDHPCPVAARTNPEPANSTTENKRKRKRNILSTNCSVPTSTASPPLIALGGSDGTASLYDNTAPHSTLSGSASLSNNTND